MPYVIVDYKGDDLLNSSNLIREIGLNEIPSKPGIYIVHPTFADDENVESWLWGVHAKERVGLYIDECYMIPGGSRAKKGPLQAILTQGRSKKIPVIALTQRPIEMNRFIPSEADHFAVFHLNSDRDQKVIEDFLPRKALEGGLPEYNCKWYDVKRNKLFHMKPVPMAEKISQRIEDRLTILYEKKGPARHYY